MMTNAEIANRIREALYEIEGGTSRSVAKGEQMLNRLVGELETGRPWDR
jgi:hypothetical protein